MRRVQRMSRVENGLAPTATSSRSPLRQMALICRSSRISRSCLSTRSAVRRRASSRSAVRLLSLKKLSAATAARSPR